MVQGTGFEPAKHYALGPKPSPFDHSGTPAMSRGDNYPSRSQRIEDKGPHRVITGPMRPPDGKNGTNRSSWARQLGHRSSTSVVQRRTQRPRLDSRTRCVRVNDDCTREQEVPARATSELTKNVKKTVSWFWAQF